MKKSHDLLDLNFLIHKLKSDLWSNLQDNAIQ